MNLHASRSYFVGLENISRKFGDDLADSEQSARWHDALELRNEDTVSPRVIPNANISASSIFLDRIGHVVGWNSLQHFRWIPVHSHIYPRLLLYVGSHAAVRPDGYNNDTREQVAIGFDVACMRHNYGVHNLNAFQSGTSSFLLQEPCVQFVPSRDENESLHARRIAA